MIHLQIAYVAGFNNEGLHLMSSLQNIDKSLVLSLWVCVKENISSAERGDLDFILGFPGGKLHDLERGINEEPFRGAGHFQLPLNGTWALCTDTPGKISTDLGPGSYNTDILVTVQLLFLSHSVMTGSKCPGAQLKGLKSVPGPFLCQICSLALAVPVWFLQHE